jgi:Plavaka transposase
VIHPLSNYTLIYFVQPFTNDFPRADIHQLISFDLLHQLVKGAFKDHLVDWVVKYLRLEHGTKRGDEIMSDIDRRYTTSLVNPAFSNLESELLLWRHSLVYGDFLTAAALNNGRGTIPKPL